MPVEGPWVDRLNGLDGVQVDITMMRTPEGQGHVELTKFRSPPLVRAEPAPPNTLASSRSCSRSTTSTAPWPGCAHGAELVGEVVQYEDKYRLGYLRGPAGIIVALAEEL